MDKDVNNIVDNRKSYLGYKEDNELLKIERAYMKRRKDKANEHDNDLVGLALSGGGIRSASFCLGVLQAMAKYKALKQVDYLSTVSGGGYIGSSLSWFLHKTWDYTKSTTISFGVKKDNFPFGTEPNQKSDDPGAGSREKMSILRHFRQNINYLFPGNGIGPMALFSALLRGFFINILVYGPVLVFLLMLLALVASQGVRFDTIALWMVTPFDAISSESSTYIEMGHLSYYLYLAVLMVGVNVGLSVIYAMVSTAARSCPTFLYVFIVLFYAWQVSF